MKEERIRHEAVSRGETLSYSPQRSAGSFHNIIISDQEMPQVRLHSLHRSGINPRRTRLEGPGHSDCRLPTARHAEERQPHGNTWQSTLRSGWDSR